MSLDQRDGVEKWARQAGRLIRGSGGVVSHVMAGGAALSVYGFLIAVLFIFKPWASCPDDSVPAACPSTSVESAILLGAAITVGVGLVLVLVGFAGTCWRARISNGSSRLGRRSQGG